jgi:enamine deaminase RidA (YjgF/YER057c/UK114 family)
VSRRILHPEGWSKPSGYSHGIVARGTHIFIGGQIGWNAQQQFESDDLVAQIQQALQNCLTLVQAGGGQAQHIVRMTWYLKDKRAYLNRLKEIGVVYRQVLGPHYPAMSAVQVSDLMEDRAQVEIEVTAVV